MMVWVTSTKEATKNINITNCRNTTNHLEAAGNCRVVARSNVTTSEAEKRTSGVLVVLTLTLSLGGYIYSLENSLIGAIIFAIREELNVTKLWNQLIVSSLYFSGYLSVLASGFISDKVGRRDVVIASSLVYIVSTVVKATARDRSQYLVARIIAGVSMGIYGTIVPIYMSEVAPAETRARVLLSYGLFFLLGMVSATLLGGVVIDVPNGWRYVVGLGSLPALIQVLGLLMLPDSPRWLASNGRVEEARKSLKSLRPSGRAWEAEFHAILADARANTGKSGLRHLFASVKLRRALLIGTLLYFSFAFTGFFAFLSYSGSLVRMAGIRDRKMALYVVAVVISMGLLGQLLAFLLVERMGRRPFVLASLVVIMLGLLLSATALNYAYTHGPAVTLPSSDPQCDAITCEECTRCYECGFCFSEDSLLDAACVPADLNSFNQMAESGECANETLLLAGEVIFAFDWCPFDYAWVVILGFVIFVFGFNLGIGSLPRTINTEIFPLWARSIANNLAISAGWLTEFIITFSFLDLAQDISKHGVFYLLAGINAVFFFVFLFLLPETKSLSLENTEKLFQKPLGHGVLVGRRGVRQ